MCNCCWEKQKSYLLPTGWPGPVRQGLAFPAVAGCSYLGCGDFLVNIINFRDTDIRQASLWTCQRNTQARVLHSDMLDQKKHCFNQSWPNLCGVSTGVILWPHGMLFSWDNSQWCQTPLTANIPLVVFSVSRLHYQSLLSQDSFLLISHNFIYHGVIFIFLLYYLLDYFLLHIQFLLCL